jgi:hypothetical protein
VGVRFERSTQALSRRAGTDVLVTTVADEHVHELSGGASAVWEELRSPRTLVELVDLLASQHETEASQIAEQVECCLDNLVRLRIVDEVQDFDG